MRRILYYLPVAILLFLGTLGSAALPVILLRWFAGADPVHAQELTTFGVLLGNVTGVVGFLALMHSFDTWRSRLFNHRRSKS